MNYSEALERQVALLRWADGPGRMWIRAVVHAGDDRYAPSLKAGTIDPKNLPQTSFEVTTRMALALGETFFWRSTMCEFVDVAAASLPPYRLTADLVPAAFGFCWFEKPLMLRSDKFATPESETGRLQALSWCTLSVGEGGEFVAVTGPRHFDAGESLTVSRWSYIPDRGKLSLRPFSHLLWKDGETFDEAAQRAADHGSNHEEALETLRQVASMFLLLNQRIVVAPPHQAERHARKRLERDGWTEVPLIRVVELRRRERSARDPEETSDIEYSCQWIVRGHWRQQACGPNLGDRRPKWILPYVKGPDDKPLKPPRATVFAVVR